MSYPLFSYKIGKFADMIGVSYQTLQRWDREYSACKVCVQ